MPTMNTKSFTDLVTNMATAIQGGSSKLIDMTIGSILRAVVEAIAAVVLWLQALILQLLATTRAATSTGSDLDSWVGDYGLTRLPAKNATGNVTFSRFTPTLQAVVPIGAVVQTGDGSQRYAVVLDAANPAYSASLGGYVIPSATASVTVPVQSINAAAAANAAAGLISTLVQAIPGVDTVINALGFTNGADAETDAALRSRFVNYVASLSKATKGAVAYALTSMQQGVSYTFTECYNYDGTYHPAYFYVVVDDGSGAPSTAFLNAAYAAIDLVRPAGTWFGVFAPVVRTANVSMTLTTDPGYTHSDVVTAVQSALSAYLNTLTLGNSLPFTRLAQIAYDATGGVVNVSAVTLNGGTADMAATNQQVIKPGTITVI